MISLPFFAAAELTGHDLLEPRREWRKFIDCYQPPASIFRQVEYSLIIPSYDAPHCIRAQRFEAPLRSVARSFVQHLGQARIGVQWRAHSCDSSPDLRFFPLAHLGQLCTFRLSFLEKPGIRDAITIARQRLQQCHDGG